MDNHQIMQFGDPLPSKYVFQKNDVFAFAPKSQYAKKIGFDQRLFIFSVIEVYENQFYKNNMVLRIKYTDSLSLPETFEEIDSLPDFVVWRYPFEFRHLPYNNLDPVEPDYLKNTYITDNDGKLPLYRMTLIPYGIRTRPKLLYIGHYQDFSSPPNEFVPKIKSNIDGAAWNTLEKRLLFRYEAFNK